MINVGCRETPRCRIRSTHSGLAVLMVGLLMIVGTAEARAAMSPAEIAAKIERRFGVSVLKVAPAALPEKGTLAVTVMNPPGAFNEAFQVNTIAVDANTGELVPVYRQTDNGLRMAAPPVTIRTRPLTAED